MSTATAYSKMSGRTKIPEAAQETDQEKESKSINDAVMLDQLRMWRQHPNTKDLLEWLAIRRIELSNAAENSAGVDQNLVNQHLFRAKEIRKVIEYVEGI